MDGVAIGRRGYRSLKITKTAPTIFDFLFSEAGGRDEHRGFDVAQLLSLVCRIP